ncbi:MAG: hypothetical protein WDZ70_00400 [Candidatus Paceibacterota bacterium]
MKQWLLFSLFVLTSLGVFMVPVHAEEDQQPPPVSRSERWASPSWSENRHRITLYVDEERIKRNDTVYLPSPDSALFDLEFREGIISPDSAKAQRITYGVYRGELNDAELVDKYTLSVDDTGTTHIDSFSQEFSFEEDSEHFIFVYRHCEDSFYYVGFCADHPTDEQIEKWVTEGFDGNDGTPEWPPQEWGYISFNVWFYKDVSWVNPSWTEQSGAISLEINGQSVSDGDTVKLLEGSDLNVKISHPGGNIDFTRLLMKGELNQNAQILCNDSVAGKGLAELETISTEINLEVGSECEHSEISYTAESGEYFMAVLDVRGCNKGFSCPKQPAEGEEFVTAADMIEWIKDGDDGDPETTEFPPKYWGTISFTLDFVTELEEPEDEQTQEEDEEDGDETATSTLSGNSNVVFLHGIKASRLYVKENGQFVKVWEPNWNKDVKKLLLDDSGESINKVYVGDPIDVAGLTGVPFTFSVYNKFFEFLDGLKGDGSINDWRAISYDWRQSLQDITSKPIRSIDGTNKTMVEIIEGIAASAENGKVTIIGHSNGGLVGKLLINKLVESGKGDLVDQFITIGTPHLGTPQTIPSILHGYGQDFVGGFILRQSLGREFAVNAPGAYTLLPSSKYFFRVDDPVITIEEGVESQWMFDAYGGSIDSYSELSSYLNGDEGREIPNPSELYKPHTANSGILTESQSIQQILDNWVAPAGITTTNFAGWGRDTIKGIRYYTRSPKLCINIFGTCTDLDYAPILTRDGDNTVVTASARGDGGRLYLDFEKFDDKFGTSHKHRNMSNFSPLHALLNQMLTQQATTSSPYITTTKPDNKNREDILMLSIHSPVTMTVIDHSGNEVGSFDFDSTDLKVVKQDVPGASYFEFGEGKYVIVDSEDVAEVKIEGYEEGYFTVGVSEAYGDTSYFFEDLETTASTTAILEIGAAIEDSTLSIDYEGDGVNDTFLGLKEEEEVANRRASFAQASVPQVKGEVIEGTLIEKASLLILDTQTLINSLSSLQDLSQDQKDQLSTLLEDVKDVLQEYDKMYQSL